MCASVLLLLLLFWAHIKQFGDVYRITLWWCSVWMEKFFFLCDSQFGSSNGGDDDVDRTLAMMDYISYIGRNDGWPNGVACKLLWIVKMIVLCFELLVQIHTYISQSIFQTNRNCEWQSSQCMQLYTTLRKQNCENIIANIVRKSHSS